MRSIIKKSVLTNYNQNDHVFFTPQNSTYTYLLYTVLDFNSSKEVCSFGYSAHRIYPSGPSCTMSLPNQLVNNIIKLSYAVLIIPPKLDLHFIRFISQI